MTTVSQIAKSEIIDKSSLNIICTGPDNGKAWYIAKKFFMDFPDYKPNDVLLITSHTSVFHDDFFDRTIPRESDMESYISKSGVNRISYIDVYRGITKSDTKFIKTLETARVIMLDEFQTMYLRGKSCINYSGISKYIFSKKLCPRAEIFLAFTSAPNIIQSTKYQLGLEINWINKVPIIKHRANEIVLTKINVIPRMVECDLYGKTLIVCLSARDCLKLHKQIPNSTVLIGRKSDVKILPHTPQMERIKRYIAKYHCFPATAITDGLEHPLDVIITTCIPAEGMDFYKGSGIKNVICCIGTDFFVSLAACRMSYDYDCLIIANPPTNHRIVGVDKYLAQSILDFDQELVSGSTDWAKTILPFSKGKADDISIWGDGRCTIAFRDYINQNWLCSESCSEEDEIERRIWRKEDKNKIVEMYLKCWMHDGLNQKNSFSAVARDIESIGYRISEYETSNNNSPYKKYKLIQKKAARAKS